MLILGVIGVAVSVLGGWYLIPRLTAARNARVTARGLRREIEHVTARIVRAQENGRVWDSRTVGLSHSIWDAEAASLRAVLADEEYDFVARFFELVQRTDRLVKAEPKIKVGELEPTFRILLGLAPGSLDAIRWCTEKRVWSHVIHRRRVPRCLAPTPMSRACSTCSHIARSHEQVHLIRLGRVRQIERLGRCYTCGCRRYSDPEVPYSRITRSRISLRYLLHRDDVRRLRTKKRQYDPETTTFIRQRD